MIPAMLRVTTFNDLMTWSICILVFERVLKRMESRNRDGKHNRIAWIRTNKVSFLASSIHHFSIHTFRDCKNVAISVQIRRMELGVGT